MMPPSKLNRAALDQASFLSLRIFSAVAEARNFSAAARQLHLSPSAVTNHILLLERSIGVALFHRTTRRVAITEAGERFYQHCSVIIREIEETLSTVASDPNQGAHLRVVAPPAFALTALGPNLAKFLERYPGISVDLIVTSALPNMISERIDVSFVLREELDSKLPHVQVGPIRRAFCASPAYLARNGTPGTPTELLQHKCLANMVRGEAEGWSVKSGQRLRQINVKAQLLADNGEVLRQACLDGAGIGNFYRFHVSRDLESKRLIEVLGSYQPERNFVYAVTPHRKIILPHVEAFVQFASSILASPGFQAHRTTGNKH